TADRTAFAGAPTWTRNLARGPVQDLQVNVDDAPEEGGLLIDLDGNPALYPEAALAAHGARLQRVLEQIATEGIKLGLAELAVLDARERERVIIAFNNSGLPPPPATLCDLFDAQVRRTPDATALICGTSRLSYAGLDGA